MTSSLFLSVWKLDFRTALILTQLSHTSSSEQKFHDFAQFSSHFHYFFLFILLCTLLHPFISRRKNFVLRQLQRSASRFHDRESWIVYRERRTLNPEPWILNPEPWTMNRERESWIVNRESWILYRDNKTVMTRYRPRPVELCRNELVCFLFFFLIGSPKDALYITFVCFLHSHLHYNSQNINLQCSMASTCKYLKHCTWIWRFLIFSRVAHSLIAKSSSSKIIYSFLLFVSQWRQVTWFWYV